MKLAIKQCLIDEHYHTLLHMQAIQQTEKKRNIKISDFDFPHSIIYRSYLSEKRICTSAWQENLLALVWTFVSEVSINAYLELLSKDDSIQPMHRMVVALHNRDEVAHSKIICEVIRHVYPNFTDDQKNYFNATLPKAIYAFSMHDYSAWLVILKAAEFENPKIIIDDISNKKGKLIRGFLDIEKFCNQFNIPVRI